MRDEIVLEYVELSLRLHTRDDLSEEEEERIFTRLDRLWYAEMTQAERAAAEIQLIMKKEAMSKQEEKKAESANTAEILTRKRLLARMAGNIAAGIVAAPSDATSSPEAVADIAVDIGEAILQKIGL